MLESSTQKSPLSCSIAPLVCALLAAAASAQGVFLVDSSQDQLYAVDHYTAAVTPIGSTANNGLANPVDLTWRRVTQELWTVDMQGGEIGTLDQETATFTPVHATGMNGWMGLAWHEVDRCFYLSNGNNNLYRFTPWNGQLTLLGPTGYTDLGTLEVDADNKLYGVTFYGYIVKLDTGSGAGLTVATTTNFVTALAIEPYSGRWYAIDGSYMTLERVDPATGATTRMGSITLPGFITLPRGLTFAARRDGGIAADRDTGDLFYCDLATGTRHFLGNPLPLLPNVSLRGVGYDSKAGAVYVCAQASYGPPPGILHTTIQRFDLSQRSWSYSASLPNIAALAFDEAGDYIYLLKGDGTLSYFGWIGTGVPFTPVGSIGFLDVEDLAFDAFGNLFGVRSTGEIYAIDKLTGVTSFVTSSVPGASGLTVEARTGHFLVQAGGQLHEVDRDTFTVTPRGTLPAMGNSRLATVNHASAYVIDSSTDLLGSVDLHTGAVTAIGSTANHGLTTPADLTYQPSSGELWTVDSLNGLVGRVDTGSGTFTPVFDLGQDFTGIAWHEGDGRFYLGRRDRKIYALDLSGGLTVLGSTGTGEAASLDTDAAGNLIGLGFVPGEIFVIDRATGAATVTATTTTERFQDVGIDQLTGDMYAVRLVDDALYSIDPTTGASTVVGTFGPSFPAVRGLELIEGYGTTVARTKLFGISCGGVSATTQSEPRLGSIWEVGITAPATAQLGVMSIGLSNSNLSLSPFGAPGCSLYTDNISSALLLAPFGFPAYSLQIPAESSLVGLSIFVQGFIYLPSLNALGFGSSGGLEGRIGW